MIQLQILFGDLHKGHPGSDDLIQGHQQVFANKSRLSTKSYRHGRGLIELVLSRHIAWYATCPTLVNMWHSRDLDLRLNVGITD